MKKLLFVCSQNRLRSPTAEVVFSRWPGVEAMSAGIDTDANTPICADLVNWADVILVMQEIHKTRINKMFGSALKDKQIVVLGIPDKYEYMQPALVKLLKAKVPRYLGI